MLKKNFIIMASASVLMIGIAFPANAYDKGRTHSEMGYVAPYMKDLSAAEKISMRRYMRTENLEPCQNYRVPPSGFTRSGCDLFYKTVEKVSQVKDSNVIPAHSPVHRQSLATYEIYFAFDSSKIDPAGDQVIDQVSDDILRFRPALVTVSGYADSVGTDKYNDQLSTERAQIVSNYLQNMGVKNEVINQNAYGEHYQAVDTKDNVKMPQNRHVKIEFLK